MLKDRVGTGVLERCQGPYWNPWFLVKKANGKHLLVVSATKLNSVTRQDANLPPNAEDFAKYFAGCAVMTLLDLLSGYDQLALHLADRDMTAIMTPLVLLRSTRILQGATNSVAQFCQSIGHVLESIIPNDCRVFLDDVGVKGSKTRYAEKDQEGLPGVRTCVFEHLMKVQEALYLLEVAGLTISAEKSKFGAPGVKVVGWVCDGLARRPSARS